MSFPVAGTLMIEPTESEDLAELDRFCDAMIAIREEIGRVASGELDATTTRCAARRTRRPSLAGDWEHGYSRAEAVFPVGGRRRPEVLAAGAPDRRRATATATWSAAARRWTATPTDR